MFFLLEIPKQSRTRSGWVEDLPEGTSATPEKEYKKLRVPDDEEPLKHV
jgi:hypothetical protein